MLITVLTPLSLLAQNISVSGTVMDGNGEPVPGAMVFVKGGTAATATGSGGDYTIQSPSDAILTYQFIGFTTQDVAVNGRNRIDVTLEVSASEIEDVVVVGYGTQRRGSITGSVATVRGSEMIKTKNENPQNMLTGRIPGVRMWQTTAEPGSYNNKFDIRGFSDGGVLVVIDGIPRSMSDFQRINPNDIEDVAVLKDASAAIYGARSANGVLLITTKKGKVGKTNVNYNGSFTFKMPSGLPRHTDVYDAMALYNEKAKSINNPGAAVYDESDFEDYRSGRRTPSDWNSAVMANWAPQTEHSLSIDGGSDKTRYYIGMGYSYQESFFKSGDLDYNKFNVRSNINTEILPGLTFDLSLSGMMDRQHNPWESSESIIRNYWRQGPLLDVWADPEHTMLNARDLTMNENAVAYMTSDVSGFRDKDKKKFMSSATLNYDFGKISSALTGLSLKGMFSYDYEMDNITEYRKEYTLYSRNQETGEYTAMLFDASSPNRLERQFFDKQGMLGQFVLNYNRTFDRHSVAGLVGWEVQTDKADNFYALRELAFGSPYLMMGVEENQIGMMRSGDNDFHEYALQGLIGRINYAYDDRYLVEAQFRYDGSSKLAPGHQWHFFPSASVGWRVSEESFIKDSAIGRVVNQFKLRASYGLLGEDNGQYAWLSAYTYPGVLADEDGTGRNTSGGYYDGMAPGYVIDGKYVNSVKPSALPNMNITWATSTMFDIGFDLELWNGKLGVVFDYFDRRREGIYKRAGDMPAIIGSTPPLLNADSDRQFGLELQLTHRNTIGELRYQVMAMGTITRRKHLIGTENPLSAYASSYEKWRKDNLNNRYQGVQFGYEGAGRFQNWDDIWNYPLQLGRDNLPGDYKYEDWNDDGQINEQDEHPYAFDQIPWLNYSLDLQAQWRNFDIELLFQGSAMGSMEYMEPLKAIWGANGGGVLTQYLDRWHPVDPSANPWDPTVAWTSGHYAYLSREPRANSSFNRVSTAFLRLKTLRIGYTIPKIKALDQMNLRVYASTYNLFTITALKFVDPEHPSDGNGRLYPLDKGVTLGLELGF